MKKLLFLVPLIALLTGCPPPHHVEVFNNTGRWLYIYGPYDRVTDIAPGTSKEIPYAHLIHHDWNDRDWSNSHTTRYFVWIRVIWKLKEYQFESGAWPPMPNRDTFTTYFQIEPNGDILYLPSAGPRPAPADSAQPAGFPLRGVTLPWAERKKEQETT